MQWYIWVKEFFMCLPLVGTRGRLILKQPSWLGSNQATRKVSAMIWAFSIKEIFQSGWMWTFTFGPHWRLWTFATNKIEIVFCLREVVALFKSRNKERGEKGFQGHITFSTMWTQPQFWNLKPWEFCYYDPWSGNIIFCYPDFSAQVKLLMVITIIL